MKTVMASLIILLATTLLQARIDNYDVKGLKYFNKLCKECHGSPYKGAAMMRSRQWDQLFKNGAKKLRKLHLNEAVAQVLFSDKLSKVQIKHLKKFLMQSASDSGVVPSCDGNFCGQ